MKNPAETRETFMFLCGMASVILLLFVSRIFDSNNVLVNHDGRVCECKCLSGEK